MSASRTFRIARLRVKRDAVKKGEKVHVYIRHDAGGKLNLDLDPPVSIAVAYPARRRKRKQ